MKKIVIVLLCLLFSHNINLSNNISYIKIMKVANVINTSKVIDTNTKYKLLLERLEYHESRGKSRIVNKYGCMGLFQFKESTLRYLGFKVSLEEFRKDPNHFPEWQQRKAALKLLEVNKQLLGSVIDRFDGKIVNGIRITESGILAAAALAGHGGVKKYFDKGSNRKDGFGTSIEDMLTRFSDI